MYLNKIILASILLIGCSSEKKTNEDMRLENGNWRMEMALEEGAVLPFNFTLNKNASNWEMTIINAEEQIVVNEIEQRNDSLFIQLPIFESEFLLKIEDDKHLSGVWANYYKGDSYQIPVKASISNDRFNTNPEISAANAEGKYAVLFSPNTEDEYNAIGMFSQNGNRLSGTFATETGDYRHLEGNATADSIFLSTFDGSHAFLFKAAITDSVLNGTFCSGTHYKTNWAASLNPEAELKDPDSLTFLNEGYDKIEFSFPNETGKVVTLNDEKFQNKAIILQIMGSWCPNCLDETKYFSSLYKTYKDQGLEIIALAFERTKSEEKAFENLKRLKAKTAAEYEFLLGGVTKSDKAAEKLPMLNHIMSYPTAIFINRNGDVERIHTGFYGPSTGAYYDDFVQETEALVKKMLE